MGKIVISAVADAPLQPFDAGTNITAQGEARSRAVVTKGDRPLWLRQHELADGTTLSVTSPAVDQLFYVMDGAVESADLTAPGEPAQAQLQASVCGLSRGMDSLARCGSAVFHAEFTRGATRYR